MLVITGTQRSGTSLIARCLVESGYELGSSLWDEEVQGGYENEVVCGFYRGYLGDETFPFDDFELPLVLPGQFSAAGYVVAKFSYLLMNPAFVFIWHKFRPEGDTFLVMDRNKEDVVKSKTRILSRFIHDSILLIQDPMQLEDNYWHSLEILKTYYEVRTLQFPQFLYRPQVVNRQLAELDPRVQITEEVWNRVYDPSKVHFK